MWVLIDVKLYKVQLVIVTILTNMCAVLVWPSIYPRGIITIFEAIVIPSRGVW
jgi:hypothetical protein